MLHESIKLNVYPFRGLCAFSGLSFTNHESRFSFCPGLNPGLGESGDPEHDWQPVSDHSVLSLVGHLILVYVGAAVEIQPQLQVVTEGGVLASLAASLPGK